MLSPFTPVVSRKATQTSDCKRLGTDWLQLEQVKKTFSNLHLTNFDETATKLILLCFSLKFYFIIITIIFVLTPLSRLHCCHFNAWSPVSLPYEIQLQPSAVLNVWTNHLLGDHHGQQSAIQSDFCVAPESIRRSLVARLLVRPLCFQVLALMYLVKFKSACAIYYSTPGRLSCAVSLGVFICWTSGKCLG